MACDCASTDEENDDERFFDAREDISSASDSCLGSPVDMNLNLEFYDPSTNLLFDSFESVRDRRSKFRKWMGLSPNCSPRQKSDELNTEASRGARASMDVSRFALVGSGAVNMISDAAISSSTSNNSRSLGGFQSSEEGVYMDKTRGRVDNKMDDDTSHLAHALRQDDFSRITRDSNQTGTSDDSQRSQCSSTSSQHFRGRECCSTPDRSTSPEATMKSGRRIGWLKKLGVAACIADGQVEDNITSFHADQVSNKAYRIRVHSHKKRYKEYSAVYVGQDMSAHKGAILTMKFSPDGEYLATGGEDQIIRVWQVTECELLDDADLPKEEPACIYFVVNHERELLPIYDSKDKKKNSKLMKKTLDSACVVIPPKAFRVSEEPVHEFHGHSGDVLDLSWSNNKYLLSASIDKTVRLWQVGQDNCIKVFLHNDFVTCVQFNPIKENYFISGSIDGKIRIWDIFDARVLDWTDIKEMVTALSYSPDAEEVVVGSMVGNCRLYQISDSCLQLDTQISLNNKRKSSFNKITGFQFAPNNSNRIMVTSADSKIQILEKFNVVHKYKGSKNSGSQICASFTSDGKHIISSSEDSNVYIWNHNSQSAAATNRVKNTWSNEHFSSKNTSIALSWHGLKSKASTPQLEGRCPIGNPDPLDMSMPHLAFTGDFTINNTHISRANPKYSMTWPEENLPSGATDSPALCKSEYGFLKTSLQNSITSHSWGQVIVTATFDGRIRTFQNYGLPVHV